jgi:hypothetical protein
MNILLGDFNAKAGRKDILTPKLGLRIHKKLVIIMELVQ